MKNNENRPLTERELLSKKYRHELLNSPNGPLVQNCLKIASFLKDYIGIDEPRTIKKDIFDPEDLPFKTFFNLSSNINILFSEQNRPSRKSIILHQPNSEGNIENDRFMSFNFELIETQWSLSNMNIISQLKTHHNDPSKNIKIQRAIGVSVQDNKPAVITDSKTYISGKNDEQYEITYIYDPITSSIEVKKAVRKERPLEKHSWFFNGKPDIQSMPPLPLKYFLGFHPEFRKLIGKLRPDQSFLEK